MLLTILANFLINIIKSGRIPKHVAVIADGNRRYGLRRNLPKTEGHRLGYKSFENICDWCQKIGIKEFTVYAWSLRNFKRSKAEIDNLREIHKGFFNTFIEYAKKNKICIRYNGNWEAMCPDVRKDAARLMYETRNNTNFYVNLCLAYTTTDELLYVMKTLTNGIQTGQLQPDDVEEQLISQCLYTYRSPPIDLMIRTSGQRLSDFLNWQLTHSHIFFLNPLFPGLTVWHFLYCLFMFQRDYYETDSLRQLEAKRLTERKSNERISNFLKGLDEEKWDTIKSYIGNFSSIKT